MEAVKDNDVEIKETFFNTVFNFDTDSQNEMMNILQYSFISVILVVVLNKIFQIYIPEADESKSHLTILFEVLVQLSGLFIGMVIIHRIVTYIPTYSKVAYKQINMLSFILPFLVILFSLQTKLGDKVNIILDNFSYLWEGKGNVQPAQNNVRVKQPLSNQPIVQQQPVQQSQFDISQLLPPAGSATTEIPNITQQINTGFGTNDPNMFPEPEEPMAANLALGGSSW